VITVLARTDAEGSGHQGISAFLVPRGSPGLSIGKPEKKMGQHGSQISDVILEDAVVPAANLIGGEEGLGFKMAMKVLDRGRINVASTGVGMARRLIDESRNYALERKQFGRPIADFQLVPALIADSQMEYYAARCMTLDAAAKLDRDGAALQEAACAKYFSSEMLGGWLIGRCRFSAAPAILPNTLSNGCTVTRGCCDCTKAPARSCNW
jgi:acyl-CoA dehydrogenase